MRKKITIILAMTIVMAAFFLENTLKTDAAPAAVSNGTYKLVTALNNAYVIDVAGASVENGGNIQIHQDNGTNAQRYWVFRRPDGSYTLTCVCSGKLIDCTGAGKSDGTNIQQYEENNTASQFWNLIPCGGGYYNIECKTNGLMMDVAGGIVKNGNNVQMYHSNGTNSQKFKLVPTSPVANGKYVLACGINGSYVWDVDGASKSNMANLQLYLRNDTAAQVFSFELQSDGYYIIRNVNSGKVVDCAGAGRVNGTNMQQYENNFSDAQRWQLIPCGNGYFYIKCKANNLVADCTNGQAANGVNLQMYQMNGTASQKFKLTLPGEPKKTATAQKSLLSPVPSGSKFSRKTQDGSWYGYHDINRNVSKGTEVYAIADGKVTFKQAYRTYNGVNKLTSYGNFIEFTSADGVYTAKYCHLNGFNGASQRISSSRTVQASGSTGVYNVGSRNVKRGDVIGYIGTTGNSSGVHLHFELRKNGARIDPTSVIGGLK